VVVSPTTRLACLSTATHGQAEVSFAERQHRTPSRRPPRPVEHAMLSAPDLARA
jgi:hypothetical protein